MSVLDELVSFCRVLLAGGYGTTADRLAGMVHLLLDEPGRYERLRDKPDTIPRAVEELLRYARTNVRASLRVAGISNRPRTDPLTRTRPLRRTGRGRTRDGRGGRVPGGGDRVRTNPAGHTASGTTSRLLSGAGARARCACRRLDGGRSSEDSRLPHWTVVSRAVSLTAITCCRIPGHSVVSFRPVSNGYANEGE
ncbi:hypothetical protein Y717_07835 [Streptomyces scopuliridis RB72]|uniref:Cytochrome P450 n=1 Tax=Streptomyces scopuliridis RB72 TaxID=1440053 RepID=A0A2T7T9U3_9ACTN|nr:hypothetical protein Y717_07835 [Streptomyces scopuliridis RB72]